MVRLINQNNVDIFANVAYRILRLQEIFTHIEEYNNPEYSPCIYAMWHENQFLIHGIKDKAHLNVLISNSIDGEIIARTVEKWGFKVARGSSNRKGAVTATIHLVENLKKGESVAIMVDGPNGPKHTVKNGIIKVAQMTGAPIIPVHWYSPQKTFVSLPSWDKMKTPFGYCRILNTYGEPIYVKSDLKDEEISEVKEKIKNSLFELKAKEKENYKEAVKLKLWDKKN